MRWCLIDNDKRSSSIWSLFKAKNSDDFYLVAKGTEGLMKVSYHESGEINIGLTSEVVKKLGIPNASRFLLRAHKIPPFAKGWTLVTEIWIPRNELRIPTKAVSPKTLQISSHPTSNAKVVQIYFRESSDSPNLRLPNHQLIGVIERLDGGSVWVVATPATLPWDPEIHFEEKIRVARESFESSKTNEGRLDRDHLLGIDDLKQTILFLEKAFD